MRLPPGGRLPAAAFALILAAGCGASEHSETAAPPPHDPEVARNTLQAALDAWKRGEAKALAKRDPPIRFVDDDLVTGARLVDYALEEPDMPIKSHADVAVILSLKDARGKAVRREIHYQVTTSPHLAVLRSDP